MKIFLDTADVAEIREFAASGLVDGVTTNPSLAAKTDKDYVESLKEICAIVPGAVSGEVVATDFDGMMKEAEILRKIAKNIAVKVPLTWDGLKACAALSKDGTMVNVTLCFSPVQAWMAAKAGATFISPFIGRVEDAGEDGIGLIRDIAPSMTITASRPKSSPPRSAASAMCASRCWPVLMSAPCRRTSSRS